MGLAKFSELTSRFINGKLIVCEETSIFYIYFENDIFAVKHSLNLKKSLLITIQCNDSKTTGDLPKN